MTESSPMRCARNVKLLLAISNCVVTIASAAIAFEGRITATLTHDGESETFLYTVGQNQLRIERTETNWPHAVNIVNLDTAAVTLVFPHNRSFVRLKDSQQGIVPPRPAMTTAPGENLELKPTGETTNLLSFACARYALKQRGETMEIWATDKLFPFQAWLPNQRPPPGPRTIEEQWPELLKAKKLFPLLAELKLENDPERFSFQVKSAKEEKVTDPNGKLFQPPSDYHELEPLPF